MVRNYCSLADRLGEILAGRVAGAVVGWESVPLHFLVRVPGTSTSRVGDRQIGNYRSGIRQNSLQRGDVWRNPLRWLICIWLGWTYWMNQANVESNSCSAPKCERCGGKLELLGITDPEGKWLSTRLYVFAPWYCLKRKSLVLCGCKLTAVSKLIYVSAKKEGHGKALPALP